MMTWHFALTYLDLMTLTIYSDQTYVIRLLWVAGPGCVQRDIRQETLHSLCDTSWSIRCRFSNSLGSFPHDTNMCRPIKGALITCIIPATIHECLKRMLYTWTYIFTCNISPCSYSFTSFLANQ